MTQQTNGMPELKYSEETFRDMYEALIVWDKLREMQSLDSGDDIDAILQECSEITDKALDKAGGTRCIIN